MRAAYIETTGGLEVLKVGEQPRPKPGPNDVLIRVHASCLDRVHVYAREGSHGMKGVPKPYVAGQDMAGEIVEVGAGAAASYPELKVGARVVALGGGAHAEFAVAPAVMTFLLPQNLDFAQAAAIPTAGRTAYQSLIHRARIAPGEDVLIVAGGSGVGSFGIQIARATGCRVITTVGGEEKMAKALAAGAHAAIDHYKEDVAARVKALTGGTGVHAVLDHVGTSTWESSFAAMRPFGRFVTTGVTAGHKAELHLGQLFTKGVELHGIGRPDPAQNRRSLGGLLTLVERGQVRPIIDTIFPLEKIAEAHQLMESSAFFGKIVLTI